MSVIRLKSSRKWKRLESKDTIFGLNNRFYPFPTESRRWNQWRIQRISEGMTICRRGWRSWSETHVSTSIWAIITLFFRFYFGKMQKKIPQGGGGRRFAVLLDPPLVEIIVLRFKKKLFYFERLIIYFNEMIRKIICFIYNTKKIELWFVYFSIIYLSNLEGKGEQSYHDINYVYFTFVDKDYQVAEYLYIKINFIKKLIWDISFEFLHKYFVSREE